MIYRLALVVCVLVAATARAQPPAPRVTIDTGTLEGSADSPSGTAVGSRAGTTAHDTRLAEAMSDYWAAFASKGDPNAPRAEGKWPRWPSYHTQNDVYLELGAEIVARRGLRTLEYDALDALARQHHDVRK